MKWVPHHSFEVQSTLSASAALDALKAHVEPRRLFRIGFPSSANDKRFQGTVEADGFKITRNSFLPEVTGKVRAAGSRSVVDVEMKLFAPVVILVIVVAAMLFLIIGAVAFEGDVPALASLLIMPGLAYGAVLWAFWFEAEKQERALREIFNGT